MTKTLVDNFDRVHDYLRISLTERCNLRCFYCMPEDGVDLMNKEKYMTANEIIKMAKIFVDLGVKKIRLTGGEPLIRKDAPEIIEALAKLPIDLGLTTNGIVLDQYIPQIKRLGLKLNFSLDSLSKQKNYSIVKRDHFEPIMKNLKLALKADLHVKINNVLMQSVNEDEIIDFIELTKDASISVRFIEFMPFNGNHWSFDQCVPDAIVLDMVEMHYGSEAIKELPLEKNYTARTYRINNYKGTFGLISTVTKPFCQSCNRMRLTADGKLKNCLFSTEETDLLTALRQGEDIEQLIRDTISSKHEMRGGLEAMDDEHLSLAEENRSMIRIGG